MKEIQITNQDKIRIDTYLIDILNYSRNKIQKMINLEIIKVNNKKIKNNYILKENDIINIYDFEETDIELKPTKMDLDIIYEDDDIIIINKANGIVVHPALGNSRNTLVNGLLYHNKILSNINDELRPGVVHRIDAYTTGLIMFAKNNIAHEFLSKQLKERTVKRKYIALVWGVIKHDTGTIDAPIGRDLINRKKMDVTAINSKSAVTYFKVIERYKNSTLVELNLETGRTHQIRVHMNYIGYPIINDPVYSKRKLIDDTGQCLHASELGFIHPVTKQYMEFKVPIPNTFSNILNTFKSDN